MFFCSSIYFCTSFALICPDVTTKYPLAHGCCSQYRFLNSWNSLCSFLLLSVLHSIILLYSVLYLYFAQNTMWHSICKLLLYTMPYTILKYLPKGEGFHPSHTLEINILSMVLFGIMCQFFVARFAQILRKMGNFVSAF